MSDPVAVRTLIARFVTETCQAARKRERDRAIKDEEESKRDADIAAARTLCSTPPLQSSPRNLRKPPPPPQLPPQRVPSSSDSGTASMASVCTAGSAAVRYVSIRADQRREPQPVNPFGDGDEGERHGEADTTLDREDCPPKGSRVTGREDQSLPSEVTGNHNDDEEDNEYIDEEFECDQQEDQSDSYAAWGAPSTEEKELTDEVDKVTPQRWRQKGYGVDRYGDRDRAKSSNTGNPFGDSDSDD
jgi:hypothetical protein